MYLINVKIKGTTIQKNLIVESAPIKGEDQNYHYVYEVYIPSTNMYYTGVRSYKNYKKDKYIGSSLHLFYKNDIIKSGKLNFTIKSFFNTREEAEEYEENIIDESYINRKDTYNLKRPISKWTTYNRVAVRCPKTDKIGLIKKDDYSSNLNNHLHINCKPIFKFNKKGELIEEYSSVNEASLLNDIQPSNLSVKATTNTMTNGYIWTFDKSNIKDKIEKIHKRKYIKRRVYQYTLDGKLVYIFETLVDAVKKYNNNSIGKCCRGDKKYNHVCNFIWLYEKDISTLQSRVDSIDILKISGKNKKVYQYTLSGELVKTFNSYQDATKETNIHGISKSCRGYYKQAGGFIWLYEHTLYQLEERVSKFNFITFQ